MEQSLFLKHYLLKEQMMTKKAFEKIYAGLEEIFASLGVVTIHVKSEFEANKKIAEMHLLGYRLLSFIGNGDKSYNLMFTSKDIRYE